MAFEQPTWMSDFRDREQRKAKGISFIYPKLVDRIFV